jgi:hypothetical protein
MHEMPASVRPVLRRLARRLTIGLFLDVWPVWAVASLLVSGLVVLICRMFFPGAAPYLHWLWLAPVLTTLPAIIICALRAYRPAEVVAMADWLSGGQGMLLTLLEHNDPAWTESPLVDVATKFTLPRLRPWRKLATLPPALMFLALALWLPQRTSAQDANAILADDIAADLKATVVVLKQQDLITPEEEKKLEEEIDRIRSAAKERVDASSWEAADALREKVAAGLADKQDAVKWAEDSLARFAAAGQAAGSPDSQSRANPAELTAALEKLARSGLLAGAPADLQGLLKAGKLPTDPEALSRLAASLSAHLAKTKGRLGGVGRLGKEFGRFDPSEFPLDSDQAGPDGDGNPGRGGITRGRADAELTWGKETAPFDRFKASPLPPGAARSADDWAPVVELPGAPRESPGLNASAAARQYAAAAGQSAWRRTLAPRHQSAVKKYFEK